MHRFLTHWFTLALALGVTAWILPGVRIESFLALLVAALVLGFLNAVVKPVLVFLTLPITILTLGIFYFVLNGVLFALGSVLVPGFEVASFAWAFVGAILMGLLSLFIGSVTRPHRR